MYNVNVAVTRRPNRSFSAASTKPARSSRNTGVCSSSTSRAGQVHRGFAALEGRSDTNDPKTVQPMAESTSATDHQPPDRHRPGGTDAREFVSLNASSGSYVSIPGVKSAALGRESSTFWPHPRRHPEGGHRANLDRLAAARDLGTLSVGVSLDGGAANRSVADHQRHRVRDERDGSRLDAPHDFWPALVPLWRPRPGAERAARQGGLHREDAGAPDGLSVTDRAECHARRGDWRERHHPALADGAPGISEPAARAPWHRRGRRRARGHALELRDCPNRHASARGPQATMREMAATGDLTRRITAPPGAAAWEDEDARLLATTFNTMTDSIARFQREAGQRERCRRWTALDGRRARDSRPADNRQDHAADAAGPSPSPTIRAAVADIDEETARLNRPSPRCSTSPGPSSSTVPRPTSKRSAKTPPARPVPTRRPSRSAWNQPIAAHRRDRRRAVGWRWSTS